MFWVSSNSPKYILTLKSFNSSKSSFSKLLSIFHPLKISGNFKMSSFFNQANYFFKEF
ncbi:hypothetical protein CJE0242 [Campylobacter jejuni RM1221]|uniref:Uncharacterized protein n=1 Tax=Campylobacter jejuni TaxID=197 RepID=E5F1T1_CAMJU|nr:hypothetical protein CJE0242 [Campylobacter jejuni RM1221]ADR32168.1 hypothetical protein [Campylobacter jejuni]ADW85705.1 hypothetical protein [Campylobacter jejuni]ADW85764.1 hypothetical protein [Campylobacter jejuni]ADX98408.1 hypothetical protein [Campylobacter jejuni]